MVATIDLGRAQTVDAVKMHFLDDPRHWIFLPERILVEISADGMNYRSIGDIAGPPNDEHYTRSIKEFAARNSSPGVQARYIRVTANNLTTLPEWRYRDNKKPMIACDEIYVQ
jgi:hypothetical protein